MDPTMRWSTETEARLTLCINARTLTHSQQLQELMSTWSTQPTSRPLGELVTDQ